jgi:hypothetical protein
MEDKEKKGTPQAVTPEPKKQERLTRREAMKRVAKGLALVGTLGVTAVITQGQDECAGGYANLYSNGYYNYSNSYTNYSNAYSNAYTNYTELYYNYYNYNNYSDYYNYSDYNNYSDYYNYN